MESNDEWFLYAGGIVIYNDRDEEDEAYVRDTEFSGMEKDSTYPIVLEGE